MIIRTKLTINIMKQMEIKEVYFLFLKYEYFILFYKFRYHLFIFSNNYYKFISFI